MRAFGQFEIHHHVVSGTLIFTVDKYSIYFAPCKEVLKNLEPEQFTFTVFDGMLQSRLWSDSPTQGGEIALSAKKAIFSDVTVAHILAVPPDCLFVASSKEFTLFLLQGTNQE